ncbi:MAG: molybdenum cofactor guanylyltransferase MobA [Rhodobacteraceae bacterium]|nr:molybdenum cofactor guanylyltransferase MobA [Paracoccaceae bacterium]
MKPAGVILAGGRSARMGGGDKFLLDLDGQPILDHVINRLTPQVSELVINANGDAARLMRFDLPVIADSIDGFAGPLAGVLAGMDWAFDNGFDQIVTVAADTPFFPEHLVTALQLAIVSEAMPLAMATTPDLERPFNRHPTFGLWDVSLRNDLRQSLNDGLRKVVQWTKPHGCANVSFEGFAFDPFFNVNTPDDLETARKYLAQHP